MTDGRLVSCRSVCLGRCYLSALLGPFSQRWCLFGPPSECYASRSFGVATFLDHGFAW